MMNEKLTQSRKSFDKEILHVLKDINTNDFSLVCPEPEIMDTCNYFKSFDPFINFRGFTSKDLGEVTIPITNGEYKTNMIIEAIARVNGFPNIIIKMDSNLFYLNDASKLAKHYENVPFYKDNYNTVIVEGKQNKDKFEKDLTNNISKIVDKTRHDGKKLLLIINDKYADTDILNKIADTIIIDSRGRELKITNSNLMKLNTILALCVRGIDKAETILVGTKEDILTWVFKIEDKFKSSNNYTDSTFKQLEGLKDSVVNIEDGQFISGNYFIDIAGDTLTVSITYDNNYYIVKLSTSGLTFNTSDKKYESIRGAQGEKNLAPGPDFNKKKEVPITTSNNTLPSLEKVYEDLLREYVQVTTDTPTDREARHAILAMIKDVKEMMK